MSLHPLSDIARWRARPGPSGLPSVCSAHPLVLEAAMRATLPTDLPLLIEATCNQVNQDGGYTGMTPADFRARVEDIARVAGFPAERIILGGDHLGPNPWKSLPAAEAMDKADVLVRAYAAAGFTKLHLDCSMGCAGEPVALDNAMTARRAARLAAAAEEVAPGGGMAAPVYVIGTEVPIPGGAMEELGALEVTTAAAATETVSAHRKVFEEAGLDDAFTRVIGLVVQPGVEFGNHNVIDYDPAAARELSAVLGDLPGLVFEAHSTDYQTRENLAALVSDGFAILKVGPGLTFALREALYGLDSIATELVPEGRDRTLRQVMETVMLADPSHWGKYYEGDAEARRRLRHFSYSDRIRYYWPNAEAEAAVARLFDLLEDRGIPEPLIGQYLGRLFPAVRSGEVLCHARPLVLASIESVMQGYIAASFGLHRETGSLRRG
ncbi:D-tagatose-bisphosphate aldolase, class II, non-catalytic subunit [Chelativorans alearense]|uniref:D-tagatose-bisphosphate aldolase, class II, non-catalytic subunit n=1 Tax=Chelativorans alearense TaxID=2681495 RepID=UPI0013D3167E|nr:D-tagatose-bisphosphate aldolase, class II, non-catalytic subunit [Chelativorans alearense]